ncbi:hypothetical protein Anapl_05142 [Anas platyrhynchos]|uniref:Uncharacterized protein n=1 Tax=Anas platyrhynchos TaxID=8839 RepID=R0JNQ0_ANAPL|nr:hypothetical protein Anapl_05142 [Anas platyrhynchos]
MPARIPAAGTGAVLFWEADTCLRGAGWRPMSRHWQPATASGWTMSVEQGLANKINDQKVFEPPQAFREETLVKHNHNADKTYHTPIARDGLSEVTLGLVLACDALVTADRKDSKCHYKTTPDNAVQQDDSRKLQRTRSLPD